MKKNKKIKRILSLLLCTVLMLNLLACGKTAPTGNDPTTPTNSVSPVAPTSAAGDKKTVSSTDLMEGIMASATVTYGKAEAASLKKALDFATKLFKANAKTGENTLVSPLSVLIALSMTANGAENETLEQMENVLGLKLDEVNKLLGSFIEALAKDEKTLSVANAIWFKDESDFKAEPGFLQTNADIYKASVYKAPFDNTTLKDINGWVEQKTKGMIKDILDEINPDAVMYLVNALAFDAKWEKAFAESDMTRELFNNQKGDTVIVDYMKGLEDYYIKTGVATGFQKYYEGGRYSMIALLPSEGKTTDDVIASLADTVINLNDVRSNAKVRVSMPKFTIDYKTELGDTLKGMGMPKAFTGAAEFGKLGKCTQSNYPICISRVIHQTHIEVGFDGTKAAAATVVEMAKCTAYMPEPEVLSVVLDKPFVYMLFDEETGMPFFIGIVNNL